jgi:hypothetical protein
MPFAECRLAVPADDEGLRRILRENPFPGAISLSFEREPDYFLAAGIEGPFHQTMVVCESQTGSLMGMGDRATRPLWVNGQVHDVGYFSGLRARKEYREGLALARFVRQGFAYYRQLHSDGRAPFYLISIIADNLPARRLLTSGLEGLPHLQEYTRMLTFAIHPARPKPALPLREGLRLVRGSQEHLPALLDCLNRNGAHKQFFPYWTEHSLFSRLTPGLMIEDFFLVLDGNHVTGCLALWDQNSFKQVVVRGYSGALGRFRKIINWLAPLGGWPSLPATGTHLNQCYACFLAIDGNDPAIFAMLLRALHNEAARRGYSYLLLGLTESDPLCRIAQAYRPLTYTSQVYLAAWDDGLAALAAVDRRAPALEVALL